jgi:regulator of nucleoside diphosphate kinase
MTTDTSFCHLTTGDHLVLEAIVDRFNHQDTFFAQMLRRKTRDSRLYLREDIPADVAILESSVVYAVDGREAGPHQLVDLSQEDVSGDQLSIYTPRGLALLGLREGASAELETDDGHLETIKLVKVTQPLANGASAAQAQMQPAGEVIAFRAKKAPVTGSPWTPSDDPGPTAA